MKTGNFMVVSSVFAFLTASLTMSSIASAHNNAGGTRHQELASRYENLAKEMQTKVQEQTEVLEVLNNRPHFSFFDKNGQGIKKYVFNKIHICDKAAAEYLEKAAYHHEIAAKHAAPESTVNQKQAAHQ
jgi:hypothetical protein